MNELILESHGGTLVMTLNRPEAKNAMTQSLARELAHAFDQLDLDPKLRVGVITGAGGNFCSGMDLKAFLRGELPRVEGRGFGALTQAPPKKPLIAAVEGYALAGGFEMVLACDLIVAARDARFGLPEVRRGLVANAGGLIRLPRRLPYHIAMQHILTGDFLSAERAEQFGLVNAIQDPGKALEGAIALADKLQANGPMALITSKQVAAKSHLWQDDDMFELQAKYTAAIFASEDAREGARAFTEKRAPVWKGR